MAFEISFLEASKESLGFPVCKLIIGSYSGGATRLFTVEGEREGEEFTIQTFVCLQ